MRTVPKNQQVTILNMRNCAVIRVGNRLFCYQVKAYLQNRGPNIDASVQSTKLVMRPLFKMLPLFIDASRLIPDDISNKEQRFFTH